MLKIHIFDVKYADYNKYVVESPETVTRNSLSIRIKREKKIDQIFSAYAKTTC